jgi:hypothetical protein
MCTFVCTGKLLGTKVVPSTVAETFFHAVKVASLAPIDYNSVKYKSKLPELYLLLRRVV